MSPASRSSSVHHLINQPSSGTTIPDADTEMADISHQPERRRSTASNISRNAGIHVRGTPASHHAEAPSAVDSIEILGSGVKELVHAIDSLVDLGITSQDLPLPQIVVVGDQSAGKSSLIEAISEIKVPRSSGTCTRCPLQIRIKSSDKPDAAWTCRVSLHKKYDYYGDMPPDPSAGKVPMHPWVENRTRTITDFKTVHHKEKLEHVLQQAQLATLNPGQHPLQFANARNGQDARRQVEFSPNVIVLEISAPGLPNLSFIDLPGVINQTEDGSMPYLVKLVKNLVKDYVRPQESLVLLACSMESDMANSSAAKLVRGMGADRRCIGVLTKPDRMPQGDPLELWKAVLNGDKFTVSHGYYVTKQPSQPDLNRLIDHAEARDSERLFFESQDPWATYLSDFKDRFGTSKLQEALSQKLTEQIRASLPAIRTQVQQKIEDIEGKLKYLPEPPTANAQSIVLGALTDFASIMQRHVEGSHPHHELRLTWRQHCQTFKEAITSLRPTLIRKTDAEVAAAARVPRPQRKFNGTPTKREHADAVMIESDSEQERSVAPEPSPSKRPRIMTSAGASGPQTPRAPQKRCPVKASDLAARFKLEDIRKALDDFSASDIGEVDPKAVDFLILKTFEQWDAPMKKFLDDTETVLRVNIRRALDDVFCKWKTTDLYKESSRIIDRFLTNHMENQRKEIAERALRLERFKPITWNSETMEVNRMEELEVFQHARYEARANAYLDEQDARTGKATSLQERHRRIMTDQVRKEVGPDPYQREVEVMAKVRAYYNIASMRFVDHICQSLQVELIESFRTDIREELMLGLQVKEDHGDAQAHCVRLLVEDPAREVHRQALKKEREKLVAAQGVIDSLDLKYRQVDGVNGLSNGMV
ncbi:hypothetical protein H2201_002611 [Coniosporium apollinis]|uniref:GED domain-containing protein n=1 Tax=Coniosporium apollinis TaxID=61459 RepID=A0ABQ9NYF4_9PEZI|nr:hypothetical protein H2201_002611 [Coniosporium apollinis]